VPNDFLLEIGDTDAIIEQFSDERKENYAKYVEGNGVKMSDYLEAMEFDNNSKGKKDKNGKTISGSKRDETINFIDKMDVSKKVKRAIFLGLGYSSKNIPWWWK
jgi:hypothetical protein